MKTQIVYVLVSSENDYYLEELWVSLYSLRQFHPDDKVLALVDDPTAERIKAIPEMFSLVSELKVIPVPKDYSGKFRSREIKTNIRNLIDGDFLFIDTDTVICQPLDDVDNLDVENIAMVPELHGPFKDHLFYELTANDTKRIFGTEVFDSPYWFNSGCMFVRDNAFCREYFNAWNKNWKHSAFNKNNSSDQRALLATDQSFGYKIECLPGVYNAQVAMSIEYFYDAKIVHFWHTRGNFDHDVNYSPFTNKEIYKQLRNAGTITNDIANTITHCKSSFRTPAMIIGKKETYLVFSGFNGVLYDAYNRSKFFHWFLSKEIKYINLYYRAKKKIIKE